MDVYLRILRYLRPYRGMVILGLVCMLFATPLSLLHPWVWKYIVDEVVTRRRPDLLAPALAVMVTAHGMGAILGAIRNNLLEKAGQLFVQDLRNEVYRKLQGQSLQYLQEHRTGDLVSRAIGDVDVLQQVVINGTESILSNAYSFLIVIVSLLILSPLLGSLTILPILVVAVCVRIFNTRVKRLYRSARDRLGDVSARLQENLSGIMVVKAFAKEENEAERFRRTTEQYREEQFRAVNLRTRFFPLSQFVGFISNVIAIGFGALLVLEGRFTVGGLVAYRGYWWQLYSPISSLAQINDLIQRGVAAGGRVFEILDQEVTIQDAPDARALTQVRGRVTLENVHFSYKDRPVLRGIDLDVRPGEAVALVGTSGAGKSTLVNLIPRFWDPQEGSVRVDGVDVREVTGASLRRHVAMVLQETFLFSGTVLENVRYARPDATLEEARAAAAAANALSFIEGLPNGWETEIGERGVKLSGGQRQRISIARAFLADPEILILDEATSAVEPESEWIIQQALERLMQNRTTLIISHRLSIVRGADRIVVLDQGRVAEEGRHEELLARGGLYAEMYRMQMGHLAGSLAETEAAVGRG
ncbi:MAG: ABC transporter ATP-binding protein [Armatimonadota bacterium]